MIGEVAGIAFSLDCAELLPGRKLILQHMFHKNIKQCCTNCTCIMTKILPTAQALWLYLAFYSTQ